MAWNNSGTSLITASVATNVTVTRNASTGLLTVVSSSRDTKENFSLPEDTSWVLNLQAIEYEYIGSGWKQLGFIAEEVAEAYPQAGVHHDGPGEGKIADFDTRAVLAALQNEVKKLRAEVDNLRARRP